MLVRLVTWVLLLNFLNTIFFVEVSAYRSFSNPFALASIGSQSAIDSLVELILISFSSGDDALPAESDFDDTPDHLKRVKFQEFFLSPQTLSFTKLFLAATPAYCSFQERLPSHFYDVFSPPPRA